MSLEIITDNIDTSKYDEFKYLIFHKLTTNHTITYHTFQINMVDNKTSKTNKECFIHNETADTINYNGTYTQDTYPYQIKGNCYIVNNNFIVFDKCFYYLDNTVRQYISGYSRISFAHTPFNTTDTLTEYTNYGLLCKIDGKDTRLSVIYGKTKLPQTDKDGFDNYAVIQRNTQIGSSEYHIGQYYMTNEYMNNDTDKMRPLRYYTTDLTTTAPISYLELCYARI